jgi:hypothetical protein
VAPTSAYDLYGIVDLHDHIVVPLQYKAINLYKENVCLVNRFDSDVRHGETETFFFEIAGKGVKRRSKCDSKFDAKNGYQIIDLSPAFDFANLFEGDVAPAAEIRYGRGCWGLIDKQGNWLIKPKYKNFVKFGNNLIIVSFNNKIFDPDNWGPNNGGVGAFEDLLWAYDLIGKSESWLYQLIGKPDKEIDKNHSSIQCQKCIRYRLTQPGWCGTVQNYSYVDFAIDEKGFIQAWEGDGQPPWVTENVIVKQWRSSDSRMRTEPKPANP